MGKGESKPAAVGVAQLGYMVLGVSDLGAWRAFGCDVLGLQDNSAKPGERLHLRLDAYHHRIEARPTGEDDLVICGWEVKDAETLKQICEQISALGVDVRACSQADADERMVLGLARFEDVNGVTNEIYFGPYLDPAPFTSPCGVSGFKAGALGLGHVVLAVDDLDRSLAFYQAAIGVRLSDFIFLPLGGNEPSKVAFTHVNPRHHSLAMVKPPMKSPRRLNHFMIEANTLDDVGRTLSRFQAKRMPAGQLGRHTNDHMVSFYAPTPSGFAVEFGCNGRTIDDESAWEVQHYRAGSFWGHGAAPSAAAADGDFD